MNPNTSKNLLLRLLPISFLILGSVQVFAASDDERAAFNEAYQEYQEIVAGNGDRSRLTSVAEEVYRLGVVVFGEEHANTAALSLNYARSLNGEAAIEALEDTLEIYENVYGEGALDLVDPYMELAQRNGGLGNMTEAKEHYLSALELVEEHMESGTQLEGLIKLSIGIIDTNVAVGFRDLEDHQEQTVEYLEAAQGIFASLEDQQSNLYLAQTNFALGNYQIKLLDFEEAVETLLAALETFSSISATNELTINTHKAIVGAYELLNEREESTKHLLAIAEAQPFESVEQYEPVYLRTAYPGGGPGAASGRRIVRPLTTAEGFTRVTFTVDEEGYVVDPEVLESEGSRLFPGESLRVIREFRYAPRLVNGEAVDTPNVEYRFTHTPPPGAGRR